MVSITVWNNIKDNDVASIKNDFPINIGVLIVDIYVVIKPYASLPLSNSLIIFIFSSVFFFRRVAFSSLPL